MLQAGWRQALPKQEAPERAHVIGGVPLACRGRYKNCDLGLREESGIASVH